MADRAELSSLKSLVRYAGDRQPCSGLLWLNVKNPGCFGSKHWVCPQGEKMNNETYLVRNFIFSTLYMLKEFKEHDKSERNVVFAIHVYL